MCFGKEIKNWRRGRVMSDGELLEEICGTEPSLVSVLERRKVMEGWWKLMCLGKERRELKLATRESHER